VTIPRSDWDLCRRYKATLIQRIEDVKLCTSDGKRVRDKKNQCVGELAGKTFEARRCALELEPTKAALVLARDKIKRRKPATFWASVGTLAASLAWASVELFAGERPELVKMAVPIATGLAGGVLLLFTW